MGREGLRRSNASFDGQGPSANTRGCSRSCVAKETHRRTRHENAARVALRHRPADFSERFGSHRVETTPAKGGKQVDWWARTVNGDPISVWAGVQKTNITSFPTPNADGKRYPEVFADYRVEKLHSHADFDVWYTDIFDVTFRTSSADFDRDGKADGKSDPTHAAWKRKAMADFVKYVKKAHYPNALFMGNCTGWFQNAELNSGVEPIYPEYEKLLDGGLQEMAIGPTWAFSGTGMNGERVNTWGSFELTLESYRYQLRHHKGELVQYQPAITIGNWKTLRYGLGIALLANGFYSPNVSTSGSSSDHSDIPILDEYTRGLPWKDPSSTKWLGQPVPGPLGPTPAKAYENGVWVREFQGGLVVVNPHVSKAPGKSPVERTGSHGIALPPGKWRKIAGSQDPAHNDGKVVGTTLSVPAGDAYLLVRDP